MSKLLLNIRAAVALSLALGTALALPRQARADAGSQDALRQVFEDHWQQNLWGDESSRSGPGSRVDGTRNAQAAISRIIGQYGVRSVVDAACGDFGWMSLVDMGAASYTGVDIVPGLIEHHQARYASASPARSFQVGSIVDDELPHGDLVVARDVIGHLSLEHGMAAVDNIRRSGARWLLTTTFPGWGNMDMHDGGWRPVNLSVAPFNLGEPVELIREGGHEAGGVWDAKSLALYDLGVRP
jgi:hypothetical protein